MRSDPKLLSGVNKLWIRFFQMAVFATMFVRDHARVHMHEALGVDPEEYGMDVFRITQEISTQVFPVLVDIENPKFLAGLRRLQKLSVEIAAAGRIRRIGLQAKVAVTFLGLLALPVKKNPLPEATRLAPTW